MRSGRAEDLGGFPVGGRAGLFQTHSQQSFAGNLQYCRTSQHHISKDKRLQTEELERDFCTQLGIVLLLEKLPSGMLSLFFFSLLPPTRLAAISGGRNVRQCQG